MRHQYDTTDLGNAMLKVFEAAELCHMKAAISDGLEPAGFYISPEALNTVHVAAEIAGVKQGDLVSAGIALVVEIFCRREGPAFRAVFEKRQAERLKALKGQAAPGAAKE